MYKILDGKANTLLSTLLSRQYIKGYLTTLKKHHLETYEHSLRVARLSIDLARENELSGQALTLVGYGGLFHDLGKSRLNRDILSKDGPLTPEEFEQVKQHPRHGFVLLREPQFGVIRKIVTAHHEFKKISYPRSKMDRRTSIRYPAPDRRKLQNNKVLVLAQIVAAADMFDALAFPRAYKPGFGKEKIQAIMTEEFTGNKKLIPQLLRRLIESSKLSPSQTFAS